MDKRPIGYKAGEKYILDQKIPKSSKYQHVKKTVNTGATIDDVQIISKREKGVLTSRQQTGFQAHVGAFLQNREKRSGRAAED